MAMNDSHVEEMVENHPPISKQHSQCVRSSAVIYIGLRTHESTRRAFFIDRKRTCGPPIQRNVNMQCIRMPRSKNTERHYICEPPFAL